MTTAMIEGLDVETVRRRRREWVTALRSGEYWQTKGALFRSLRSLNPDSQSATGFCCLGVAAKVWNFEPLVHCVAIGASYDSGSGYSFVKEQLGCSEYTNGRLMSYLVGMNDGVTIVDPNTTKEIRATNARRNFRQIARFAEIVFTLDKIGIAPEEATQ